MASVMSLAMMVFITIPVVAPSFGQAVMLLTQWRGIFIVLMLYGVLALAWSALRMPETLPVSERKSLAIRDVLGAFRQTVTNRQRSEEHTSELQSHSDLVCRLLLEKK